jgi:type I restriction enzyme M protein
LNRVLKNIDDILRKDAGCGSELDYVKQTSWVLFLKYLDDLEKDKENAALLSGAKGSEIELFWGGFGNFQSYFKWLLFHEH